MYDSYDHAKAWKKLEECRLFVFEFLRKDNYSKHSKLKIWMRSWKTGVQRCSSRPSTKPKPCFEKWCHMGMAQ